MNGLRQGKNFRFLLFIVCVCGIEMCDGLGNRYELNALENGNTMITKLQADGSVDVLGQSVIVNTSGVVKEKVSNYTRDGLL
jgi:hypothetical protein